MRRRSNYNAVGTFVILVGVVTVAMFLFRHPDHQGMTRHLAPLANQGMVIETNELYLASADNDEPDDDAQTNSFTEDEAKSEATPATMEDQITPTVLSYHTAGQSGKASTLDTSVDIRIDYPSAQQSHHREKAAHKAKATQGKSATHKQVMTLAKAKTTIHAARPVVPKPPRVLHPSEQAARAAKGAQSNTTPTIPTPPSRAHTSKQASQAAAKSATKIHATPKHPPKRVAKANYRKAVHTKVYHGDKHKGQHHHRKVGKPTPHHHEYYRVQIASFASAKRANQFVEQLRAAGQKAYSATAQTPIGKRHRIYIGPVSNAQRAQKIVAKVNHDFHVKAIVKQYHVT